VRLAEWFSPGFVNVLKGMAIMIEQSVAAKRQGRSPQDFFLAARMANKDAYATVVLDQYGKIHSCGEAGERLFGANQFELNGQSISAFIVDFFLRVKSRSYLSRFASHLKENGRWREFRALDTRGRAFLVELSVYPLTTDGQDFYLLNLRRLGGVLAH